MNGLFIVLTGLLVLVNAFFVIAEYALVRSRRTRLEALVEEGARGARLALRQQGSAPLLAGLHQHLLVWKKQLLPRHPMAEAIQYALNQWTS